MLHVYTKPEDVLEGVADAIVEAAAALEERDTFFLGLSGGETSARLCRVLAEPANAIRIDWPRVRIGFADERAVPPDHADSNYRLIHDHLMVPLGIPVNRVVRMRGEAPDLDAAAREYELVLAEPFDLLILGIGSDGHTASIFAGSPAVREMQRHVVAVSDSPKPPPRRLTVTPRTIVEARAVLVMAWGSGKASAVLRALDPRADPVDVPAALVRDREWHVDRELATHMIGDDA